MAFGKTPLPHSQPCYLGENDCQQPASTRMDGSDSINFMHILFLLLWQKVINGHASQCELKKTKKKKIHWNLAGENFISSWNYLQMHLHFSWMGPCEDVKAGTAATMLLLLSGSWWCFGQQWATVRQWSHKIVMLNFILHLKNMNRC